MCRDEKKAVFWSNYINCQLAGLWKNAKACDDEVPDKDNLECKYYRALASYDYAGPGDQHRGTFSFIEPKLTFICNHTAILSLGVAKGSILPVNNSSGDSQQAMSLDGREAFFRVTFTRTHVMGRDSKIDDQQADHEVRMVIFDFNTAVLVLVSPNDSIAEPLPSQPSDTSSSPVALFFKTYLKFLHEAGHHVLFGLPDFTDKKVSATLSIDYATISRDGGLAEITRYCKDVNYRGISADNINDFLKETQYIRAKSRNEEKRDMLAGSIAKINSKDCGWGDVFEITFEAPTVVPLCPDELLFVLTFQQVERDGKVIMQNWIITYIVNVSESDGKTQVIKVNFRTARRAESFSSSLDSFESTSVERSVTSFISEKYLNILTKYSYNVVYSPPEVKPRAMLKDGGFWRRVDNITDYTAVRRHDESTIWSDRSQHVSLSGTVQAFALSERSIESLLLSRWENEEQIQSWRQDDFQATFGPFRIQLLSNDNIILFVDIKAANIHATISQTNSKQPFRSGPPSDIFLSRIDHSVELSEVSIQSKSYMGVLAFEVNLKVITDNDGHHEFVLDMSSAKHVDGLSDLYGADGSREKASETTMTTIRQYIQQYLEQLQVKKLAIIGKISCRDSKKNFSYRVLSEKTITTDSFLTNRLDVSDSSLIVVFGTDSELPAPRPNVSWSPGWLPSADANGVGTFWISNENFLQRLLGCLEDFNSRTTIVREAVDSFITVKERNAEEKTPWRRDEAFESANLEWLAYTWDYKFDASKREGTIIMQDLDSFLLRTQNRVWIPTEHVSRHNQIKVALTGEHTAKAEKQERDGSPVFTKLSTVWWKVVVTISSSAEGLQVSTEHEVYSQVTGDDRKIKILYNAEDKLKNDMPSIVTTLEEGLRQEFGKDWVYNWFDLDMKIYDFTNPVFTRTGDLVFEVYRAHTANSQEAGTTTGGPWGPSGKIRSGQNPQNTPQETRNTATGVPVARSVNEATRTSFSASSINMQSTSTTTSTQPHTASTASSIGTANAGTRPTGASQIRSQR